MTQYVIFPSAAAALAASQADWAQRVLGHPTLASNVTKALWGNISNAAGTIGVMPDGVIAVSSWISSSERALLLSSVNPTVAAVLAAQLSTLAIST